MFESIQVKTNTMKKVTLLILILITIKSLKSQFIGPDGGRNLRIVSGSNTYAFIPHDALFNFPNEIFTIEAWVNPSSLVNDGFIFSKHHTNNSREYDLAILAGGRIRFAVFNSSDQQFITESSSSILLNRWTHIAATFNDGVVQIYINGILNRSNNFTFSDLQVSDTPPLIGAYWLNVSSNSVRSNFIGQIDEVRVWSEVRSQNNIREFMCRNVGNLINLVGYFPFDESDGNIALNLVNSISATIWNITSQESMERNYSGAPIGNASSLVYFDNSSSTVELNGVDVDDIIRVSDYNLTNNSGIQLFAVNSLPSRINGLTNPNNNYFGVFLIGAIGTYDLEYINIGDHCGTGRVLSTKVRESNGVIPWNSINHSATSQSQIIIRDNSDRLEIILDCEISLGIIDDIENEYSDLHSFPYRIYNADHSISISCKSKIDKIELFDIQGKRLQIVNNSGQETKFKVGDNLSGLLIAHVKTQDGNILNYTLYFPPK